MPILFIKLLIKIFSMVKRKFKKITFKTKPLKIKLRKRKLSPEEEDIESVSRASILDGVPNGDFVNGNSIEDL